MPPQWSTAASTSEQTASERGSVGRSLDRAQSAWTDYSTKEHLALRSAIASAHATVDTSFASVHAYYARLHGHADTASERLSLQACHARDTASSTTGAVADCAQAELPKRVAVLRSAW